MNNEVSILFYGLGWIVLEMYFFMGVKSGKLKGIVVVSSN